MSTIKEGLSCPGEAEDKCCWCIPIKIGVILIGISMILLAASMVLLSLLFIGTEGLFIYGVLMGVAAAPLVLGAWFFLKFCMADSADTRAGMT